VGVVDDAEQRPLFGRGREKAQHRRTDDEALRCRPFLDRERSPQRGRLRLRELVDGRHGRAQQLLRACECDLGFRFDAERAQDVEVAGSSHGVLEQRALADPRLAPKDEGGASPRASRVQLASTSVAGQPVTQTLNPPPPSYYTCKAVGNGTI